MNKSVQVLKVVLLPRFYQIISIEYFETSAGTVFGRTCDGCHKDLGDQNPKATVRTDSGDFLLCLPCQKKQRLTREETDQDRATG